MEGAPAARLELSVVDEQASEQVVERESSSSQPGLEATLKGSGVWFTANASEQAVEHTSSRSKTSANPNLEAALKGDGVWFTTNPASKQVMGRASSRSKTSPNSSLEKLLPGQVVAGVLGESSSLPEALERRCGGDWLSESTRCSRACRLRCLLAT